MTSKRKLYREDEKLFFLHNAKRHIKNALLQKYKIIF